uniref:N-acetyltransferase domain-containing protein n=1 Tax=Mycena chlorophos TaxID=658473 RepID=A0ABQ0M805_MYCCL|nr:predicted protein [Mycena chlorophos]
MNAQLHPLELNPATGEPFLHLPGKEGLVLTPPRMTDVDAMVEVFNDERIYYWLTGTPFPYTKDNAIWWLALKLVDACPVSIIREVKPDGSDVLVGGIDFTLAQRAVELDGTAWTAELLGPDPKPQRHAENPDIWTVGYYVAPAYHGRGIMSVAFKTVLEQWGIPRMGIRKLRVSALTGNEGSVRVFEKNGLKLYKTWPEDTISVRGTRMSGVHIYEATY